MKAAPFARKRFGQHFLTDQQVVSRILEAANPQPGERILEIGPGRGVLTGPLLASGAELTVVEIDRDLAKLMQDSYGHLPNFHLIQADVLKIDWPHQILAQGPVKLVSNLPYNISSPLFFKLFTHRAGLAQVTLMLQKELALRLVHQGKEGSLKDYGALSVTCHTGFDQEWICKVPPGCFNPPPQVESAVIRLTPRPHRAGEEAFPAFVRQMFNQRRKLLYKQIETHFPHLAAKLTPAEREHLSHLRPENLSPQEWQSLYFNHCLPG